jgi:hypothetical protein
LFPRRRPLVTGMVRPRRTDGRDRLRHRRVEPSRPTCSHRLCLGTRPGARTPAASLSLHRPRCRPARHSALVHPPLVDRGHFRRRPPPPLRVETQRQWSEPAFARTTPILLGLFSLITLWANKAFSTPRRPDPKRENRCQRLATLWPAFGRWLWTGQQFISVAADPRSNENPLTPGQSHFKIVPAAGPCSGHPSPPA